MFSIGEHNLCCTLNAHSKSKKNVSVMNTDRYSSSLKFYAQSTAYREKYRERNIASLYIREKYIVLLQQVQF